MNHTPATPFTNVRPRLAHVLIGLLIGLHVVLLGAGAFCASRSLDPNPSHHSHPAQSVSLLCSWACHVAQIASGASPIAQWSALFLPVMFWSLTPVFIFSRTSPLHRFSPRGPPVRFLVHG